MDVTLYVAILLLFAAWVTIHVCLSLYVARRVSVWRGVVALFVPPLAPVWGRDVRPWSRVWIVVFVAYLTLLGLGWL